MDGSKGGSIDFKVEPHNLRDDFQCLSQYLSYFSPSFLKTPFECIGFKLTKDKHNFIVAESNGRIAICSKKDREIVQESSFPGFLISSFDISENGKNLCIATNTEKILVVSAENLQIIEEITTGYSLILRIISYGNDSVIVSYPDGVSIYNLSERSEKQLQSNEAVLMSLYKHLLVTASSNHIITILDLETNGKSTIPNSSNVAITCLSVNNYYLCIAFSNEIQVYSTTTWSPLFTFSGHSGPVVCMDICGDILASGSQDSELKIWKLNEWNEEITLYGHDSEVVSVLLSNEVVHSLSRDGTIRMSHIPPFPKSKNFKIASPISQIIHNEQSKSTYAINSKHEIFDLNKLKTLHECREKIIGWGFTKFGTILAVFYKKPYTSTNTEVALIKLDEPNEVTAVHLRTSSVPSVSSTTSELKYLITGEMFRITVWKANDGTQEYIFRAHNADITAMVNVDDFLFAGDAAGCIKQYSLKDFTEVAGFNEIDSVSVRILKVSNDFRYLFSVNQHDVLKIWSVHKKAPVYSLKTNGTAKELIFSKDFSNFFLNFGHRLEIWSLENFTNFFTMTFKHENLGITFANGEKTIISAFEGHYMVFENPLYTETISFYGNTQKIHRFVEYLSKIFEGSQPKFRPEMNDFIIQPFHMNVSHVYAYCNMHRHLGKSLESGAAFYPSKIGHTPMSIALLRSFGDCVSEIIKSLMPRLQQNPVSFYYLGQSLSKLNFFSPDSLHLLYELGFRKSLDRTMPQFCVDSVSLPIIKESSELFLPSESFMPAEKYQSEDRAIEFTQSYFTVNMATGSSESMDFAKSLVQCKNLEVFTTLFIKNYIDEKWTQLRWIHFTDAVLYFVYLAVLCFTPPGHKYHWVLIVSFVINQVLLIYEFFQMFGSKQLYFTSFINYVDLVRHVFFNLYCAIEFFDYHEDTQDTIFLITVVVSLLRGFGYFRVFYATRWVVYLVIEVFYQLWAFIFVTFYTIISLGITYQTIVTEETQYKTEEFKLEWLMLFFIIIINPLIILNLFISIVGNALEKIKDERVVKEKQELAEMIFEAEILYFWRRNEKKRVFLHICNEEQANIVIFNSVSERIRNSAAKSESLIKAFNKSNTEIKALKETFKEQLHELEKKTDLMLELSKKN